MITRRDFEYLGWKNSIEMKEKNGDIKRRKEKGESLHSKSIVKSKIRRTCLVMRIWRVIRTFNVCFCAAKKLPRGNHSFYFTKCKIYKILKFFKRLTD